VRNAGELPRRFEERVVRKILEFGLIAAIFVAVGGFGGTPPIPRAVFEILILLLGLILCLSPSQNDGAPWGKFLMLPATLCAWVAIQWIGSRYRKIGIDTSAIEKQGIVLVSCFTAFFVSIAVARERGSRDRLAHALICLGLFEALYGLAEYLAGWQYIWNVPRRYYLGSATGTFFNHDHFAGFLEMILPLSLGLALYHWQKASERVRRRRLRDFFHRLGNPEMLKCIMLLLAATLLFLALVFSFSRMGLISMLVSLGVMAAALLAGKNRGPVPLALVVMLIAGGVAVAGWVGVEPVVKHFEELSRDDPMVRGTEGRAALWRDTLKLIREQPWTGTGLGTFVFAFTRVQSHELAYTVEHAHNDYLEFAADLGIPAAAVLFLAIFLIAARTFQASRVARSGRTRALALGTFAGVWALLVHGLADFNLQIPANAIVFSVLLGMGCAIWLESSAPASKSEPARRAIRDAGRRNEGAAGSATEVTWEPDVDLAEIKGPRSN
jgi:O-antigen ligase